jgi:hypothetical protein
MAATFISAGHIVLAEAKRLTFLRLPDVYQSLRKTAASKARLWLNTFHPPAAP